MGGSQGSHWGMQQLRISSHYRRIYTWNKAKEKKGKGAAEGKRKSEDMKYCWGKSWERVGALTYENGMAFPSVLCVRVCAYVRLCQVKSNSEVG